MKSAPKGVCITFTGQLHPSLVHRFEVLSGRDFSAKVFSFSAYKAITERIAADTLSGEKLLAFRKDVLKTTAGGRVSPLEVSKQTGGSFCEFAVMPGGAGFTQENQQETQQGLNDLAHG